MQIFRQILPMTLLLLAPACAQGPGFEHESDVSALEVAAADRELPARMTYRMRLQSVSPAVRATRVYQRFELQDGAGRELFLLSERDPGERSWHDFSSFYLRWTSGVRPLELVAGDLRPGFGQGLLFSRASRGGVGDWRRRADHTKAGYRSSSENDAFRGLAVRHVRGALRLALVGGTGRRDASINASGVATALSTSGIHVTRAERAGRDGLRFRVLGARLQYAAGGISAGLVGQDLSFDRRVDLRRGGRTGAAFSGKQMRRVSADIALQRSGLELVMAMAGNGAARLGSVIALRLRLPPGRLAAGWRQYNAGFENLLGAPPAARGGENESGIGARWEGGKRGARWHLAVDQHRQPQAAYSSPLPRESLRWSGGLSRRLRRGMRLELRFQTDERQNGKGRLERTRRLRFDFELRPFRVRAEGRRNSAARTGNGVLLSVLWRPRWRALDGIVHLSRYATDSYAERIYEYEYDLPGAYSIRPLYDDGWRFYARAGIEWAHLEIILRYRLQAGRGYRHHVGLQLDLSA